MQAAAAATAALATAAVEDAKVLDFQSFVAVFMTEPAPGLQQREVPAGAAGGPKPAAVPAGDKQDKGEAKGDKSPGKGGAKGGKAGGNGKVK